MSCQSRTAIKHTPAPTPRATTTLTEHSLQPSTSSFSSSLSPHTDSTIAPQHSRTALHTLPLGYIPSRISSLEEHTRGGHQSPINDDIFWLLSDRPTTLSDLHPSSRLHSLPLGYIPFLSAALHPASQVWRNTQQGGSFSSIGDICWRRAFRGGCCLTSQQHSLLYTLPLGYIRSLSATFDPSRLYSLPLGYIRSLSATLDLRGGEGCSLRSMARKWR